MFKSNTDTLDLIGQSGTHFQFRMCEFDTLQEIDEAVKTFTNSGLYIFAHRYSKPNDPRYWYSLKYIGETDNYSNRNYSNHHKKHEIEDAKSNAWGYCIITDDDDKRKGFESDLIARYNPPCNG